MKNPFQKLRDIWNTSNIGRLIIVATIICLCGCCFVVYAPVVFPISSTSDSNITNTPLPTEIAINTFTLTPKTSELPPTDEPTNTPLPSTATPTAIESLVDVYSILGKPVNEVEAILGSTILITPNDDNDDNLSGGEYRDYEIGKYSVFVAYDKNGIARVFQVMDGLSDENYSLTQWEQILPQFGVYINTPPERTAPLAVYWDNYNGYFIAVAGDPVWTVQIAEAEYHP